MKDRKVIYTTILIVMILFFLVRGVAFASQSIVFNLTSDNNAAAQQVQTQNVAPTVVTPTNIVTNTVTETVPQTGESDTFIIASIGAVAVVIGIASFIMSKKK
jgi:LPXTG-motif cell wall-anchored protein